METPGAFWPDMTDSPHNSGMKRLDQDIRAKLQALPTKQDIEALILLLEETHHRDIQESGEDIQALSTMVASGEAAVSLLEQRVPALEHSQVSHADTAVTLQLHLEDWSHCNNLWLQGLPEVASNEDLAATVTAIF